MVASVDEELVDLTGVSRVAAIGDLVSVETSSSSTIVGSVVRISPERTTVLAHDSRGLRLGQYLYLRGPATIRPDASWLGSTVDALGRKISGPGNWRLGADRVVVEHQGSRPEIKGAESWSAVGTGVKALDLFTPICRGQRIGIFAGSGVGKSTLLNMIVERASCDVAVVALVGERRREVADFLALTSPTILQKSICVVATSDEPALMRSISPLTAITVAEHFRRQGLNVLLVIDSLTRFAHAVREILLAGGAAPVARGYPAGVAGHMARLVERAGPDPASGGAITGVFSVLVDGDDHNDPVADAARGFLDGHIVLDRAIAERTQYPPVDILKSISRLADRALSAHQRTLATHARKLIASYEGTRDLRAIGAYQRGFDPFADSAVEIVPRIYDFLNEAPGSPRDTDPFAGLARILGAPFAMPPGKGPA